MCSSPKAPVPPPRLPEAPTPPATGSAAGGAADIRRRRRAAGESTKGTILTGPRGTTDGAATTQKTLLGQ